MKPYYSDDWVTIYHGDSGKVLPCLPDAINLVLTDPPYGIGNLISGTMSKARLHKTQYASFVDSEDYVKSVCIPIIEFCVKNFPAVIVTPGFKMLKHYPQWDSFGTFYMPAAVGMQLWGSCDNQPILYYGKPFDIGKRIKKCSYVLTESPSCKDHPCAKPLKAWSRIVSDRSEPGHLLLDPFMGSGTTLRAAKNLNRNAIGIEIEEQYCEIAANKMTQEVLQLA